MADAHQAPRYRKRVTTRFSALLLDRLVRAAQARELRISELIRAAVRRELDRLERERMR